MRRFIILATVLALFIAVVAGWGWRGARADPAVRSAVIRLPNWPNGAAPVRAVLLSDVHIGSSTMDPDRLTRVVAQVAALRPDLVLIAGDFMSGHDPADAEAATGLGVFAGLHPRFGVIAVPGNHDH